jgi:antitoxin HicB
MPDHKINYLKRPYARELIPNEDGTWFARIVEFPGCMTEGDTQAEALMMLDDAMKSWVEIQIADGNPIPEPVECYSGKFLV